MRSRNVVMNASRDWPGEIAGSTSIVMTHRLALARRADRVIVLEHRAIVRDGPPDDALDAVHRRDGTT